jgi:hypothetical protein
MKNYHVGDYNLFWFNIRENVKQRCDAYIRQQAKLHGSLNSAEK